jgi:hypothetical protein
MTSPTEPKVIEQLPVDESFAAPAPRAALERAADGLRAHNFEVYVVPDGAGARELLLRLLPEGAEVGQGASVTLDDLGITEIIERSGRYDAIRPRARALDRVTQVREIKRLGATPEYWLNSAQALTEDGVIVFASATGSQLGPIAYGAGKVILVLGAQKVVPDMQVAMARLARYSYPLEDAKMQRLYGVRSDLSKMLILARESVTGRITVILVREPLGT